MPFTKGHNINAGSNRGGRKGYEWEEGQHKKMVRSLTRLLNLHSKIYSGKASPQDITRYEVLEKMGLKMMDKLHASKQHTEVGVDDTISEVKIHIMRTKEDIKNYENSEPTINDSIPEELGTVSEEGEESSN